MYMLDYLMARFQVEGSEDGQTMAEYAVVLAVITIGILVALRALGVGISGALDDVTAIL